MFADGSEAHTYSLSYRVDLIRDLKVGQLFLDLVCKFLWSEAHGIDVVGAHTERFRRRLHHLQRGSQTVINVHHGQPCIWLQVALKLAGLDGVVENLHGIVWKSQNKQTFVTFFFLFFLASSLD